uniref:Uncharacterized protein n=1 Tax=Oryza meridionalis TaxID=40149 RepID=A0A0E0F878_9ORYZ
MDIDPGLAVKQASDGGVLVDSLSNNLTGFHADCCDSLWFIKGGRKTPGIARISEDDVYVTHYSPIGVSDGGNVICPPPVVHLAYPDLDVLDLRGETVADGKPQHKPGHLPEAAEDTLWQSPSSDALHVLVDAVLGVAGEFRRLLHPRQAVPVLGAEEREQVVHHFHLVLDELHIAAHAAEQLCLADEHRADVA